MVRCVDDQFISFSTDGGTEHMRVNSDGEVGIGTTSPGAALDVQSANASNVAIRTTNGYKMQFLNSGNTTNSNIFNNGASGLAQLDFQIAGSTKVTIDNDGDVGIGIASPASVLHLRDSNDGGATELIIDNSAAAGSTDELTNIRFRHAGKTSAFIKAGREADLSTTANTDMFLALWTTENDSPSEKMRVTAAGNVGINQVNPQRKLHVVGDVEISGTIFQSGSVFEGGGGGGGGSSTFVGLSDTPANFTSSAGKFLQVNSAADALEFVDGNGLLDITTTRFTGDGSTSGYALSETINKEQNLIVTVGGLVQTPVEDYTLVGGTGVFLDENVVSGAVVEVRKIAQNSFSQNDSVAEAFTGNGVVSGFGLSIAPLNADPANVLVALNGVLQQPTTSYVVDGLNVVFAPETVASGDIVDVRHTTLSKAQPNYHQDIFTGNGVISGFSMGRTVSNILETTVFVNGLAQISDVNYFVDGTGLTFVDGDIASGDLIMVRHVY